MSTRTVPPWNANQRALEFLRAHGTSRLASVIEHSRYSYGFYEGVSAAERGDHCNPFGDVTERGSVESFESEWEGWEDGFDKVSRDRANKICPLNAQV